MASEDQKLKPIVQCEAKTQDATNNALQLLLSRRNAIAGAATLALASSVKSSPANALPEPPKQGTYILIDANQRNKNAPCRS
jgi:hypothetical protein